MFPTRVSRPPYPQKRIRNSVPQKSKTLLDRLAATFDEFFHLTAAEWESDLDNTAHPATVLQLWNTVADVFDYYTWARSCPAVRRAGYFHLILRFFNHPGTCLDGVTFDALTPGRAKRVVAEMEHFFNGVSPADALIDFPSQPA